MLLIKKCPVKFSFITILFILLASIFFSNFSSVTCDNEEEYTYYGVIPNKICQYVLNDTSHPELGYIFEQDVDTVRTKILVSITATRNNTKVRVYNMNNNSLVSQTYLNVMQKLFVLFPTGSMFKVVTDKYASVMLLNFPNIPPNSSPNVRDPMPNTFQASINGTYVGKEFIFMASWNPGAGQMQPYRIYAVEKADVKITDENGTEQDISILTNSYKDVALDAYVSYRVESTGNIMIQAKENQGRGSQRFYYFVPSAEGGFVGRVFYTKSTTDWDSTEDYGFRISAIQDSEVTIWDLDAKGKIGDYTVKGGEGICVQPKAEAVLMQSTEPVTVEWLANGSTTRRTAGDAYGGGIAYIGVKPNEDTLFLLPTNSTNEAYIFAYEHTTVTIDDNSVPIDAGSYYLLTIPGKHKIVSDQNIVIEIISWPLYPSFQGLNFGGVELPCIQLVNVVPNVTLTPLEETSLTTYIIIGVAIAALAVVLGYFFKKRRTK